MNFSKYCKEGGRDGGREERGRDLREVEG